MTPTYTVCRCVRRWWNFAWLPPWLFRMTRVRYGWRTVVESRAALAATEDVGGVDASARGGATRDKGITDRLASAPLAATEESDG